jgi:solute carrier family 30 (zinc transporter), member 5/7
MFAFSHAHSHGGEACSGHSTKDHTHDHGHSHDSGHDHGHSHDSCHDHHHDSGHDHGHSHTNRIETDERDENLIGVYLHVMADTLGSVGVITSTLLIKWFGWTIADPICSLAISIMILLSVIPLLKSSSRTLLHQQPDHITARIPELTDQILLVEGVVAVRECHIWKLDGTTHVATLCLSVAITANEQTILSTVRPLVENLGATQITIQIDKGENVTHGWRHDSQ